MVLSGSGFVRNPVHTMQVENPAIVVSGADSSFVDLMGTAKH